MKVTKKILIPILVTLILLGGFLLTLRYISKNDYVFKVNGEKITMSEFNSYLTLQKNIMEQEVGENVWNTLIGEVPAIEIARNYAKDVLIDTVVRRQQAKQRNISLTNEERESIRTEAELYVDYLKDMGITKEEFIKISEDSLIIDKLALALFKENPSEYEDYDKIDLDSYLKGVDSPKATVYSSRHILFVTTDKTDKEKLEIKKKAENVLKRIKNGEDFATLATEFTEDPGSKENGGLYEGIGLREFVPEYEKAILESKPGELYPELVETSYGYHIIKCEDLALNEGFLKNAVVDNIIYTKLEEKAAEWNEEAVIDISEQQYNSAQ